VPLEESPQELLARLKRNDKLFVRILTSREGEPLTATALDIDQRTGDDLRSKTAVLQSRKVRE